MTKTKLLIGSLSNDLFRVANLTQRGSFTAAQRFWSESKKWTDDLSNVQLKTYIKKIVIDINDNFQEKLTLAKAEKLLMYGILLQNYSLKLK